MILSNTLGRKSILLALLVPIAFLGANAQILNAAESGCVTCHLDEKMLKQNITVQKGQKSAMQSGAG